MVSEGVMGGVRLFGRVSDSVAEVLSEDVVERLTVDVTELVN